MAVRNLKHLSKQEAARRQLDTAIRLFFEDEDPVSIHVLASAAHSIARDVCRAKGIKSTANYFESGKADSEIRNMRRNWNVAYNFLKHANKDPWQIAHFRERLNDIRIWQAFFDYRAAFGQPTAAMTIFWAWISVQHPALIAGPPEMLSEMTSVFGHIKRMSRKQQKAEGHKILLLAGHFKPSRKPAL